MNSLRKHIEKEISITDDEFSMIEAFFRPIAFKKNNLIIKENEKVDDVFFIQTGLVKLFYLDNNVDEHIISFAMEDWWETDFNAYFRESKATLNLKCIEDTEVLCLSLKDYRKLCNTIPKMERFFLEKSISGHIANQNRIISMLTSNAKEKYEQFLKIYPSLHQRISKKLLASYLGVSRETLSRLYYKPK